MKNVIDVVHLSSDDELGEVDVKPVKLELDDFAARHLQQQNEKNKADQQVKKKKKNRHHKTKTTTNPVDDRSSNALSNGHSSSTILDQGPSPVDDTGAASSTSPLYPAPLCRQFWKAGNYNDGIGSKVTFLNGKNYLHVHPMFLHSNATSHKWAFGAIAELLDNAFDEVMAESLHFSIFISL